MDSAEVILGTIEQAFAQGDSLAFEFRGAVPVINIFTRLVGEPFVFSNPKNQSGLITATRYLPLERNDRFVNNTVEPIS